MNYLYYIDHNIQILSNIHTFIVLYIYFTYFTSFSSFEFVSVQNQQCGSLGKTGEGGRQSDLAVGAESTSFELDLPQQGGQAL